MEEEKGEEDEEAPWKAMDEDCKADSYYRKLRENCKTAIAPQIYRKVDALPWCII
jgi:hypothetical protein